jgi:hypothetical protein
VVDYFKPIYSELFGNTGLRMGCLCEVLVTLHQVVRMVLQMKVEKKLASICFLVVPFL